MGKKNKNKNRKTASRSQSRSEGVQSPKPEPEPEKISPVEVKDVEVSEEVKDVEVSKEVKADEKLSEEEVKEMVAKVEGKCKNIKDNIADMAMSEQYLRTKQAMLKAKKKELKITEEIIQEKDGEKDNLEKRIEASRRRESYVEKKIIEKKCDNSQNPANKDE